MRKKFALALFLGSILPALASPTPAPAAGDAAMTETREDPALALLQRHGWTPTGPAQTETIVLSKDDPATMYSIDPASSAVGLPLRQHLDHELELRAYPLGKLKGGHATGYCLFRDGKLVGAYLGLDEAVPGIAALDAPRTGLLAPAP